MNELQKELSDLRSYVEFLKADRLAAKKKEDSEKWTRWVSLTIVFLAVAAALANQQYGGFSGRAVRSLSHAAIAQGNATNKWSYFSSVSIKLHMYEFEARREEAAKKARKAMLAETAPAGGAEPPKEAKLDGAADKAKPSGEAATPKPEKSAKKSKGDKLGQDIKSRTEKKIAKYKGQKPKIEAEARELEAQVVAHRKDSQAAQAHTAGLTLALAVLQVAIAVGSISALAKKKPLWFVAMAIGGYGVFETFNGIFLWI